MLVGDLVILRARIESDMPVLHAELYDNVVERSRADHRAWQPVPPGPNSKYAVPDPSERAAVFSAVERANDELVGEAVLWGIDTHHRSAHVGLSLRPAARGRGLGVDAVRVLTRYGFDTLGLRRLQIETLSDNAAMIAIAERVGYRREGQLRASAWANGAFHDEVIYGLLADEWRP